MHQQLLFVFLIISSAATAQPGNYGSPLNIPFRLAGNFCEVRPDHFHSGIDIKTNGHIGLPVYAINDGFVSRVKVAADGFGKVIYITHPDKRVTVYAHLHSFKGALADSILAMQYNRQSFEVEWYPDSSLFHVIKGQQIAWSGNSGGSQSPHLHFEIRDALSEEPLNPLMNGWSIEDTIAPQIEKIALYKYQEGRFEFEKEVKLDLFSNNIKVDTILVNADTVSFAFAISDKMNDSLPSEFGIYSACLINGNDTIYQYAFDEMNFNESRNANGYIDYSRKILQKQLLMRCYTVPGNKFNSFKKAGRGFAIIKKGKTASFRFIVSDANGNLSQKKFYVKNSFVKNKMEDHKTNIIHYPNKVIFRKWKDANILLPDAAFFETITDFQVKYNQDLNNNPFLSIGPQGTALRKKITISFKPSAKYDSLKDKLTIVEISDKGKILRSMGGEYKNGTLTSNSWTFGNYTFAVDTIAPAFSEIKIVNDAIFNEQWLNIKMQDELSGINSYMGSINGKWVLFEYDLKNNAIQYKLKSQEQQFELYLEAIDRCGNQGIFSQSVDINQLEHSTE